MKAAVTPATGRPRWSSITGSGRVIFPMPRASKATLELIAARIDAGEPRAGIDRQHAFDGIAEAHRYAETAKKRGIVVIDET